MSAPTARLQRLARVDLGDYPADATWSSDGQVMVVAGGQGSLTWLDFTASAIAEPFGEHAGGVLALAWQGGGRLFASSGQDGEVRIWDARTRTARLVHAGAEWSEQLAFAGHGRWLAVATGRALRVFASDGELRHELPIQPSVIAAIAWRPKTHELAAVGNGGARLHVLAPQLRSREFPWPGACLTASWSPEGRLLASGMQDGSVHYWNIGASTESQMRGYGTKVTLTCWSANGRLLATAADQHVIIWDFASGGPEGSEPLQLMGHTARLTQIAFQPQGSLLAAGARDRRLTLWRLAQPQQPIDADLLSDEVALLRWSPEGKRLAAIDTSGVLSLYALS